MSSVRTARSLRTEETLSLRLAQPRHRNAIDEILRRTRKSTRACPEARRAAGRLYEATRRTKAGDERFAAPNGQPGGYVTALSRLVEAHGSWIRDPLDWTARSRNVGRQFGALARHLLADFDVPAFMDSAWFERNNGAGRRQRAWFAALGRGESVRALPDLPIALTRRAAHEFRTAPARLTIDQALRWGQLRALGADERLVDELLATPMATDFERDPFWLAVVHFLLRHPMFDRAQVRPLLDFIHHQRHVPEPAHFVGDVLVPPAPAQPGFSMAGRTPETLMRQMHAWHNQTGRSHSMRSTSWPSSRIPGLERTEGSGEKCRLYRITELLDSASLCAEGRAMRHCVGTYTSSCARRAVAIFSMTRLDRDGLRRRLTIEVDLPKRAIVQARGRWNAMPAELDLRLLRIWAQEAGLTIASVL